MLERGPQLAHASIESAIQDPPSALLNILENKIDVSKADVDFSYLTPEQRAETYWALHLEAKPLVSGRKKADKERLVHVASLLKTLQDDPETQAVFREHYDRHRYEIENLNGSKEKYVALRKEISDLEDIYDASAKELFSHRGEGISESQIIAFEVAQNLLEAKRNTLQELLEISPKLWAQAMYDALKRYSHELKNQNFMWTPSRRGYLENIEAAALGGKPLLFSGESGTGKTRLVEQAAHVLTGHPPAETPGKDVRFQDLIAKRSFRKEGDKEVVYYDFAEIGEAVTGKESTLDEEPIHEGRVVADDEFNLLEESEQNTRMSRVSAWTPGKRIKLPVTNTEEKVGSQFLYCAMVNLASDRYSRKRIPPEVLRKFAKIDVDYVPQDSKNPELYEMLLGALIDENGRLRASKSEMAPEYTFEETAEMVEVDGQTVERKVKLRHLDTKESAGGFLWRLSNALHELNKSYSHRKTVLDAKGEGQYLKDLVLDIGTVLKWLSDYRTVGRKKSLELYISERIEAEFLSKAAYTQDDRQLLKDFLKHYSIDTQKAIDNPSPVTMEVLTMGDIGLLSPRVIYKEVTSQEPVLSEGVAIIEGKRVEYQVKSSVWTDEQGRESVIRPGEIREHGGSTYQYKGLVKGTDKPIFEKVEGLPKKARPQSPEFGTTSLQEARELIGPENFFGPDALKKAFGVEVIAPPIKFTTLELQEARQCGERLILRTDTASDGSALSMKKMYEYCQNAFKNKGKILSSVDWYKDEVFYTQDNCNFEWALVSRETIAGSENKNYIQQTELTIEHLKNTVYKSQDLPKRYKEAAEEFEREKPSIEALMQSNWQQAAEKLANLQITQLTRQEAQEALFDMLTVFLNTNDERILEKMYTWTSSRGSDGRLVRVGFFGAGGAFVHGWRPDGTLDHLGVLLSRRG